MVLTYCVLDYYNPKPETLKSPQSKKKWENVKEKIKDIQAFYAKMFNIMSPEYLNESKERMKSNNIPGFGNLKGSADPDHDLLKNVFASNYTFTYKNFYNKAHLDNDDSLMTLGMWTTIDLDTNMPVFTPAFTDVKYGQFVFPGLATVVHFENHPGIVLIMWPANQVFHQTVQSIEPPPNYMGNFTRFGSSVQISTRTKDYCKKSTVSV